MWGVMGLVNPRLCHDRVIASESAPPRAGIGAFGDSTGGAMVPSEMAVTRRSARGVILLARSMRRISASLIVVLTSSAGSFACSPACDTSDEANSPTVHEGGTTVNGFYSSSSAHGPLLPFPGGKRYDVYHHLGFEPIQVQLYWSFAEAGIGSDVQTLDKSTLTPAAGNSALIQLKNDQYVRVKNDSCVDYWLLVVASGDPRVMDGGGSAMVGIGLRQAESRGPRRSPRLEQLEVPNLPGKSVDRGASPD